MFIGAAGGMALSHLPGLPLIAGVAMGIGAMAVAMLRLPLTSVLLTALFLQADALDLTPLIIVAVVVAHVASPTSRHRGDRPCHNLTRVDSAAPERSAGAAHEGRLRFSRPTR